MLKFRDKKIVLASGSPRRQQFLRDLNLDFEIRINEIEEVYPPWLKAHEITDYLAVLKSTAFEGELSENEILVTSDTIVWHDGHALGKPKDYDDAVKMLRKMSGSTHEVFTSVCLKTIDATTVFHDVTKVTFSPMSDEAIHYYLETCKPFDKAGAYGIQDWLGLTVISKIEGSYTNVVGLPTEKFYKHLSSFAD
ncbi:Maf family nucleotide pyrophosphatase [Flavobacterium selenitireducens]|uniref:Maf family nucleotide pyrophosphatase n=1 Tax=Flavobacterium selenitireducens TaxID=2722704 RepID=UPI00168B08DD|nr:Maf family nucleotide pyrophosphatase [Flavobacterium selenitireducens]MBD3581095.1 septum formation protein Maf [Flavobacterium selenitireducens]